MKRSSAALALCLALTTGIAYGQLKEADTNVDLSQITERGRQLYEYDQAAWHGTDAFMSLGPDTSNLGKYICVKTATGWEVYFGHLNPANSKFVVVYEAKQSTSPTKYEARKVSPPREESGPLLGSVLSIDLAFADFHRESRAYNTAVLPGPDGTHYVYIYPGQTKNDVWPIGGDVRYTISADGAKILDKRLLHKSIIDMQFKEKDGKSPTGGYHTHVISDVPEDTDVLYVLTRRPLIPEYVATSKLNYIIDTHGNITVEKKK